MSTPENANTRNNESKNTAVMKGKRKKKKLMKEKQKNKQTKRKKERKYWRFKTIEIDDKRTKGKRQYPTMDAVLTPSIPSLDIKFNIT